MASPRARLDVTVYRAVTGFVGVNLAVTWVHLPARANLYPTGFGLVAAASITALLVACAWQSRRAPVSSQWGLRALTAASALLIWIQLALVPSTLGAGDYPPLLHVTGAAIILSAVPFGPRLGAVLVVTYGIGFALIRERALGVPQAIAEATILVVSGWSAALFYGLLKRVFAVVERDAKAASAKAREAFQAEVAFRERAAWDGLVHDKVLGALRLAAAQEWAAAARLAHDALGSFHRQVDPPVAMVRNRLLEHSAHLGLHLDLRLQEEGLSDEVRETVASVICELLTNVKMHSGQASALVLGTFDSHGGHLTVTDFGCGFLPGDQHERAGLRSAAARMKAIGGDLEVASDLGRGTVITLTWREQGSPGLNAIRWEDRAFAPVVALGTIIVTLNIWMGVRRGTPTVFPALTAALMVVVVIVSVTAVVAHPDANRPVLAAAAVVGSVLPAFDVVNTIAPGSTDWRYWTVGALTPAVGALAFRLHWRVGLLVALAMLALLVAAELIKGWASLAPLTGPFPVMFGLVALVGAVRIGLDRAAGSLRESASKRMLQERRQFRVLERDAELTRRHRLLRDDVIPMLQTIAIGAPLSQDMSAQCSLLETTTRDGLVAPGLIDEMTAHQLKAARSRGVRVVLVQADQDMRSTELAAFREVLAACLPQLPREAVLRATANPGDTQALGTIVVVGDGAGDLTARLVESRLSFPIDFLLLDDSLMITVLTDRAYASTGTVRPSQGV